MYKYKDIRKVHLEITQNCQASCPMCDRNENGGAPNKHMTNAELTLEDCKKIFTIEFIKQLDAMYMCGNLGDPIVAKDTLDVFRYFRKHNPNMWLSMNTNAGARDAAWWEQLASIYGRNGAVIFSVDGLADTNHLYRQGVNWAKVEHSMKSFIAAGGRARWDFIVFEHNQHQVTQASELAKLWGVEKFVTKKTGRFFSSAKNQGKEEHQAQNRKGQHTAILKKPKEEFINIAFAKESELIKTYGSMMDYYDKCTIKCKVAEEKNVFVTAEGLVLPCCWTAGRMYKWWQKDYRVEQIWDFIDEVDITNIDSKKVGIEHAINNSELFSNIVNSWSKPSLREGKLGVCAQKCGTEFDPFSMQYQ